MNNQNTATIFSVNNVWGGAPIINSLRILNDLWVGILTVVGNTIFKGVVSFEIIPNSTGTPINNTDLTTKGYVGTRIDEYDYDLRHGNNTWYGANIFRLSAGNDFKIEDLGSGAVEIGTAQIAIAATGVATYSSLAYLEISSGNPLPLGSYIPVIGGVLSSSITLLDGNTNIGCSNIMLVSALNLNTITTGPTTFECGEFLVESATTTNIFAPIGITLSSLLPGAISTLALSPALASLVGTNVLIEGIDLVEINSTVDLNLSAEVSFNVESPDVNIVGIATADVYSATTNIVGVGELSVSSGGVIIAAAPVINVTAAASASVNAPAISLTGAATLGATAPVVTITGTTTNVGSLTATNIGSGALISAVAPTVNIDAVGSISLVSNSIILQSIGGFANITLAGPVLTISAP